MSAIGRRLANLENAIKPAQRIVTVFRNRGETSNDAIERRLHAQPDIDRARTTFYVLSWNWPNEALA